MKDFHVISGINKKRLRHRNSVVATLILAAALPFGGVKAQQTVPVKFNKEVLTPDYISGGAALADINKDGINDLLAGAFYFLGPDWTPHELDRPQAFKVNGGYSNSFLNFAMDVDQDGWTDFIRIDEPGKAAYWYKNPQNKPGHWTSYLIYESVGNETPITADVDSDGRMDLIFNDPERLEVLWLSPPRRKGETQWEKTVISSDKELGTHKYTHGLGFGDIDGDGISDVVIKDGWWKGPADPKQPNWEFHPANLGEECAHMYVYDINGDGLNDVLSSSAHKYGIWWHEQGRSAGDKPTWRTHRIDSSFSQTHGMALADINGDGSPDFITGKRYFAHNGHDPGAHEPAVLYWFESVPGASPAWVPHKIDDQSGIGLHLVVEDINGDGLPDIAVANKKGVHYFEQVKSSGK